MKFHRFAHPPWVTTAFLAVLALTANLAGAQTRYSAYDLSIPGNYGAYLVATNGGQQVGNEFHSIYFIGRNRYYRTHAMLWTGYQAVDLTPNGAIESWATGISGGTQSGWATLATPTGIADHACLWMGSGNAAIDLHPSGCDNSYAYGISGIQSVGSGSGERTGDIDHAFLWNGSNANCADLHPSGYDDSAAYATNGVHQVGYASDPVFHNDHAMLWSGSAASAVDLHPQAKFIDSYALGVDGGQQVGYAVATASITHALLWNGSATSYYDLNPIKGFVSSVATGISNGKQVGYGTTTGNSTHALVWSGTPLSAVDLHRFLLGGFTQSYANGIDRYGNIVGYAVDSTGREHPILWKPLP